MYSNLVCMSTQYLLKMSSLQWFLLCPILPLSKSPQSPLLIVTIQRHYNAVDAHMRRDTDVCYAEVHVQIGPFDVQFGP